jgi:hypothetical protein
MPAGTRRRRRHTGVPCRRRPVTQTVNHCSPDTVPDSSQSTYSLALGLGVDELLAELLVLGGVLAGAVDDDLLVVVRQLVDDVFVLLVELQVIVGCYALGVDGRSGRCGLETLVVWARVRLQPLRRFTAPRSLPGSIACSAAGHRKGRSGACCRRTWKWEY